jgi:hypothetical protein
MASTAVALAEQLAYGPARQLGLGEEPDGRAQVDELPQVGLGVGRDQDHAPGDRIPRLGQPAGEVEAALVAEVDVHERDVRLQLSGAPDRLDARRRHADHPHALSLQERALAA